MWPLSRPEGESGRSRLTREPARRAPRLVRRKVSGATSAENALGRGSTAVRQTPFTAMLAPAAVSAMTVAQRTRSRAPVPPTVISSTVPSSSIIPVNIHVPFQSEFVWRNLVYGDAMDADRVRPAPPADAPRQRQRLEASQDLGPVVEEDAVHQTAFERRPVHLAACLDNQREIALPGEPLDHALQIGAAARPVKTRHANAAGSERPAPLDGRRRGGHGHHIAGGGERHLRIERQAQPRIHYDAQQGPAARQAGGGGQPGGVGPDP